MANRFPISAAIASLLGITLLASCANAPRTEASNAKPGCIGCSADGKTTPRLPDGHPDLNGFWNGAARAPGAPAKKSPAGFGFAGGVFERDSDGSIIYDPSTEYNSESGAGRICQSDDCQAPNQPPYNAEYMAKVKKIAATEFGGTTILDPVQDCKPLGTPRAGVNGIHIVETPQVTTILYESAPYSTFRLIYTDGRPHPKDLETTFFGHSIGHWEGDTLVTDVVGFNDETWVGGGGAIGRTMYTSLHSDKMHVVERWTRNGDVLTYEATVDDPVAFTKPWVITPRRVQHADSGEELLETICTANFKEHLVPPNISDPDIQKLCGYRCEDAAAKTAPKKDAKK
ncbi:MAG TPA: hypothetical protein VLY24_09130 [Bryobacteraceae bacterium]|nr:hypothetical protein [Bryobacteraceae bacterium]